MTTIKSRITREIDYPEMRNIHPEDHGHSSAVYELTIKDKPIVVVIGKPKYNFTDKDVIYFPIYSLSNSNTIEAQIGIFEILQSDALKVFDDDGDIDIDRLGEPLVYPYIEKNIQRLKSDVYQILQKSSGRPEDLGKPKSDGKSKKENAKEEDDATSVRIPHDKQMPSSRKAEKTLEKGIFTIDTDVPKPPILNEETQEEAEEIQMKYKEKSHSPWIQKFMKNVNYGIHAVESNGDCFFAVIRDAFKQIGHITTVAKLRAILAEKADESVFRNSRDVYLGILGEIKEIDGRLLHIKKVVEKELKTKATKASSEDAKNIAEQARELKSQHKELVSDKREMAQLIDITVGSSFRDIDTLAKFKDFVQTPDFWANEWAISILEYELKIKIILFSELSYDEGSIHTVMNCGIRDKRISSADFFEPEYYIATTYSGNHYKLVTYKDKRIFSFHEIPYHTKMLIVNKCVEQTAGLYGRIQDFRDLLARKGINPDTIEPDDEEEEYNDLYDPEVQFNYYKRASKSEPPGKASGEKMVKSKEKDYVGLKKIVEWRKKLDDSWITEPPIEIDGKRWASVSHFVYGARYKKQFPDFYGLFSLNSDHEISKDIKMAEDAISSSGKHNGTVIRPAEVKSDPDFQDRGTEERNKAIRNKFSDNPELKQLLIITKDAKLAIHLPKDKYETDTQLMRLRKELQQR